MNWRENLERQTISLNRDELRQRDVRKWWAGYFFGALTVGLLWYFYPAIHTVLHYGLR
jgi:hypothetical protein